MNDDRKDLGFTALFFEISVVLLVCLVILCRMPKNANSGKITTPEPTPTEQPAPTFTPTPTNTPTPDPTKEPTPTPTPTPAPFLGQSTRKTYMSYKAITLKTSPQWQLQKNAYTGEHGIRMVEGRYCVALGSYWAREIGTKLDVYMDAGYMLPVILGDCKQDIHTDKTNRYGSNAGDVLEFIVDLAAVPQAVKNSGSYGNIFPGKVVFMVRVEQ